MKITKTNKDLVIKIPLYQKSYNYFDEYVGMIPNITGVIEGERCTISKLNELGYKDDIQRGQEILIYNDYAEEDDKEKFINLCKELEIPMWRHPICAYCGKIIYGSFLWGKKGNLCDECSLKGRK